MCLHTGLTACNNCCLAARLESLLWIWTGAGRLSFVQHRSAERVRITLPQLAPVSHAISLIWSLRTPPLRSWNPLSCHCAFPGSSAGTNRFFCHDILCSCLLRSWIFQAISLLYLVFQTAFCFSVVSGCFVDRVSPSLPLRPKLALTRGLEGLELAFRRLKSARKVRAKSFGP